ncbi:hypothetical protein [Burkholderia multivorans]|uniref:hypothetical protein n=1 Tax=Burkholderia multivorans TaxID=87883 RepID=UPI001C2780CD|nr:hypothetical protein [Burkholderia multivorans]MBU9552820.1 hypothetical protein [Burkholderia multivorans]
MIINLPIPLDDKSAPVWKYKIESEDQRNQKRDTDVIIGGKLPNQPRVSRLILVDSAGGQWSITVDTTGALHATKVTL